MTPFGRNTPRVTPADVALGVVSDEQRREAERLMRDDPAFRAEVDRLRQAGATLATLPPTPDDAPPTLDLDAALRARPARTSRWPRLRPRRALGRGPITALAVSAAVLLFGAGMLAGNALDDGGTPTGPAPSGPQVVLRALDDGGTQRAIATMPGGADGEMELRVEGAAPSRPGEYYELWLLDDTRTTTIGTFRVGADGTARVRFPLAIDPSSYRFLDVSIERDDGDPTHSSNSVLRSPSLS